jgi:hypothetical protein
MGSSARYAVFTVDGQQFGFSASGVSADPPSLLRFLQKEKIPIVHLTWDNPLDGLTGRLLPTSGNPREWNLDFAKKVAASSSHTAENRADRTRASAADLTAVSCADWAAVSDVGRASTKRIEPLAARCVDRDAERSANEFVEYDPAALIERIRFERAQHNWIRHWLSQCLSVELKFERLIDENNRLAALPRYELGRLLGTEIGRIAIPQIKPAAHNNFRIAHLKRWLRPEFTRQGFGHLFTMPKAA